MLDSSCCDNPDEGSYTCGEIRSPVGGWDDLGQVLFLAVTFCPVCRGDFEDNDSSNISLFKLFVSHKDFLVSVPARVPAERLYCHSRYAGIVRVI